MKSLVLVLALLITSLVSNFVDAQENRTLSRFLSEEVQAELGLQKLTSEERQKVLMYFEIVYRIGIEEGKKQSKGADVIESRIDGEFDGWDGDTVVVLMNGQIWKQSEYHYEYCYEYMPDVLIYKSSGFYKMIVEGTDEAVRVERLK